MATRSTYGQTWWGAQWLNALTQIDFDNRLPRGRSYANKGAVSHMEIGNGQIQAKVKGSQPRPYQVVIEVPPIPPQQAKGLLDDLAQDPVIIAKLLNRELDPQVLARAAAHKIAVFPAHWKDLKMRCSCPDWVVPCKHIAAVIYLVSREIDGNPFMVFALKGVDLIGALKERNVVIQGEAAAALPAVHALLAPSSPASPSDAFDATAQQAAGGAENYAALDYSTLPNLAEVLSAVLTPNPPFFVQGDFRARYDKLLKRVAKSARMALETPAPAATHSPQSPSLPGFGPQDKPHIVLDANYQPVLSGLQTAALQSGKTPALHWQQLSNALATLNEADLPDVQPQLAALYHARMTSLHLLAQGALLPQVFDAGKQNIGLRWLPAMLDDSVRALINQLAGNLPPGLLTSLQPGAKAKDPLREMPLLPEAQAAVLCGLFLDQLVEQWSNVETEKPSGNKELDLFFGTRRTRYDGPGEGAIGAGMQVWLARFHLGRQQHAPVLLLDEAGTGTGDDGGGGGGDGFQLALAVETRDAPLATPLPFASLLQDAAWQTARYPVLQTVSLLAQFFPPLNAYVSGGARTPLPLSSDSLPSFLLDTLPVIRLLGIRALLPKALERVLRPRLSMKLSSKGAAPASGLLTADDLFNFNWQVAIGNEQLSQAEFETLVHSAHGIVRFKGEYVYLDPADIARLRAALEKPPQPGSAELLRIALAGEYAGAPVLLDAKARETIAALTEIGNVAQPAALQAALRQYQERGFAWLYRNIRAGFGSVIADDMGLGKTLQVITTLLKLKEEGGLDHGKALVIVPTSLLTNWGKEIARFAPSLQSGVFHGAGRALTEDGTVPDILLTTYGTVRTDLAKLKKFVWRIVIVDEAQNIKNPAAAQTKAVKSIPAQSFIAMSGTPVENRLSEYWSIMDFANRGLFGNLPGFTKEFATPIQRDHDHQVAQRFKRVTAPFLLRRLKSDKSIISDLPDKIVQDQYCTLAPEQTALYESVVREALRVIAGESDSFQRQGLVLQMIMALKQICNHPAQYLKHSASAPLPELSGKTVLFLELLDAIHASHEKVLVFTQFREMGELLAGWIKQRFGREPQFLHGGVTRKQRDEMVERFQNDRTERVFLLSLKAGGTGLNLTAASNVIHYDLWWNPAVEAQATDRAYRIGQQRNVQVHRLITRSTFEEKINDMIQSKRDLADLTVGTGEKWIGNLSNTELQDVFSLR
jgi:uncharacterized Zn finger protein/superfamily II DNA or RNA helicase